MKPMYVYILAFQKNGSLYSGVTNDLIRRIYEHKHDLIAGHSQKYHIHQLVYYEIYDDPQLAIQREKNLKHYLRAWKINLINEFNPEWRDLYEEICK